MSYDLRRGGPPLWPLVWLHICIPSRLPCGRPELMESRWFGERDSWSRCSAATVRELSPPPLSLEKRKEVAQSGGANSDLPASCGFVRCTTGRGLRKHTLSTHPTSAIHSRKNERKNGSFKMMVAVSMMVVVMRPAGKETRSGSYHPSISLLPSFIIRRERAVSKEQQK